MTPEIKERIEKIRRGEVPEGYKKTKVATIPQTWKDSQLKKMFIRLNRKNDANNTNVLTISAQHGLISQEEFFNKDIASEDKSNYYLLKRGDFAYNKSYSNGYPFGAIKPLKRYDKGIVSPLYICFTPSDENKCPEYFEHYFESGLLNREIQAIAQEGARNHGLLNISVGDFFNSFMVIPSLPEQQKIAAILSVQDKVIVLKEKLLEEKKRQKKYLMQQLLTGQKRLPEFSKRWGKIDLSQIATKQNGKNKDFRFHEVFSNSAQAGIIPQEDQFEKDIANAGRIDGYYIVEDGMFVYNPRISNSAPCGPISRNKLGRTGVMSPLYTVFAIQNSSFNADFLDHYFQSNCWHKHMKSVANYGARHDRMAISNEDFFAMPIPFPHLEEQIAIADMFSVADREIDLLRQSIDAEKQKKKALMQLLLTGIVRVKA